MPPVGRRCRKNECQADFHRPRHQVKFSVDFWDGENERGIDVIVTEHLSMQLRIVVEYNFEPAVQYWGQTLEKNFFFRQKPVRKHLHLGWNFAWLNKAV